MGRSVTVGGTPQQEQPHHHRQHRSSRSGRSSRRSPPTAPLSYRQYAAATASTTATQPHDGHRHHHYHGDGDGPPAATPPYHSLYEAIERQAEEAADVNSSTAGDSGSYGQGSPAGASSATVKLLTELRHRATELESKLATSAREKERLALELDEATGGHGGVRKLLEAFKELEVENEQLRRRLEYSAATQTLADVQAHARSNVAALDEYRALTELI